MFTKFFKIGHKDLTEIVQNKKKKECAWLDSHPSTVSV